VTSGTYPGPWTGSCDRDVKALLALNGRFFAGRKVAASFFCPDRFERLDLAAKPGED